MRDQKKVCTIISKRLVMQAKSPVRSFRDPDAMSARMLSPISKRRGSIEESKSKKKSPPKVSFITAGNANNDGGSVMNESIDDREVSPDMGGVSQFDMQESHGYQSQNVSMLTNKVGGGSIEDDPVSPFSPRGRKTLPPMDKNQLSANRQGSVSRNLKDNISKTGSSGPFWSPDKS